MRCASSRRWRCPALQATCRLPVPSRPRGRVRCASDVRSCGIAGPPRRAAGQGRRPRRRDRRHRRAVEGGLMSAPQLPLVTLLVPAYNEALMLQSSLTTLYAHLGSLSEDYRFELLIVNDGSSDDTGLIAEAFALDRPEVRVLHNPVNFRLGEALRRGIAASRGDVVVVFDSDLSYSPDHIERMIRTLREEHARVVVASPYHRDGRTTAIPFRREAMSRAANKLLAVSSAHEVTTVTGMVRAYDGPFVRSLNLKSMGPEINAEILYKAQILRARVIEIPAHLDWSEQEARMASRRVSLKVSATTKLFLFASFLFRPLAFFVVPGLVVGLLTLVGGCWSAASFAGTFLDSAGSFGERWHTAGHAVWADHGALLVACGIGTIVAIQLVSLGMLATQAKRYFEETFHLGTATRRRLDHLSERLDHIDHIGDDRVEAMR
ncbi:MAG: glycosyltransferase family 2 protein [Ilumatobacteraceae bacterium]